jgi:hypothetical protein
LCAGRKASPPCASSCWPPPSRRHRRSPAHVDPLFSTTDTFTISGSNDGTGNAFSNAIPEAPSSYAIDGGAECRGIDQLEYHHFNSAVIHTAVAPDGSSP